VSDSQMVKTMRLRYAGTCAGCSRALSAGEVAHYLRATRTVRCLRCGPGLEKTSGKPHTPTPAPSAPAPPKLARETDANELVQGELPRAAACDDCGRRLRRGTEAHFAPAGSAVLCLDCVRLDIVHTLGIPGGGARREHAKRQDRHHARVRKDHPRLGGLILALGDDPAHVRSWQTGAVGEEEFGRRLSGIASDSLKVLHDRKVPGSSANIDHLAVTSEAVWVIDAKRYRGKVEARAHGLFSRQPPDLYVGGRNKTKLVEGVNAQVRVVELTIAAFTTEVGIREIPVRGALVFVDAEFGLLQSAFTINDVWIGWGNAICKRLAKESDANIPASDVAKRLARELCPG
jgi:hypothetical protein